MSYLINYAAISSQKTDFDNYYNEFISSNDLPQLEKTVQIMADLSEVIQTVLQDTPPYVSGFFSNWISQPRTENNQEILRDVSEKLDAMIHRIQQLSSQTVVPIVPPRLTFSSRIKTDAEDFAVGFGNMSNNCWANSLLSMIVCIPSLKEIYNAVANCYAQQNEDGAKKKCGILMQGAMRAYEIALSQKSALGSQVSQDVRMAFHGLFGHTDLGTQREIFSSSCHAQEDAYEALQLLMSEYQKVTKTPTRRLYCPLETTRRYAPYGVQKNADIDRIPSPDGTCQSRLGAYSQLDSDNATRQCCLDYQIFLDMQSMSNLSFSEMFNRFFNNRHVNDYEDAEYLLPDRKVQKFKLAAEERKFLEIPQELSLTLKRFGSDMYGNSFKITTPVAVEKVLCLPASATPENKPIPYELTAFIVHSGGISGGHYICYKKVEGRWIEANDSRVRFVTEHEIDEILQGKKGEYFTSYMHHYSRSNSCESVTSAAEQRTQNALQQCIAQELREKLAMQTLEALPNFISSGSTCLESVPSHVLSTLHHAIWLNDKTPNINEYGTKELEKNPQKIHEIKLPWLIGREESSLVDQMRLIQKQKLEIASYRTHEAHLKNFLAKLDNPMLNCDELIKTFKALPKKQIRWKLQGLIYENHKKRFGEAHVHKREYNNDYGRYVLENGDVRKTIKEAFNDQQMNIVEQLASAFNLSAKLLEIEYEKQQLEGLASLLDPSKGLTTKQLVKAFERLEIRPETRKNILKSIWLGREKPSGDNNYGGNTFAREPRCLIEITKSIIEPPLAPAGSCILRQVIALLDEEANHFINPANNRMRSL